MRVALVCSPRMKKKNCITHKKSLAHPPLPATRSDAVTFAAAEKIELGPLFYRLQSCSQGRISSRENVQGNEMDQMKYGASFSTWAEHSSNALG